MSVRHPSHVTRISMDASTYDEICILCGATDEIGSWGRLAAPCTKAPPNNPGADSMNSILVQHIPGQCFVTVEGYDPEDCALVLVERAPAFAIMAYAPSHVSVVLGITKDSRAALACADMIAKALKALP